MTFLGAAREIAEFLFALIDRNATLKGLDKKGFWGLTKLISSKVEQASGRIGSRGSRDLCSSVSLHPFALLFSSVVSFR